MIGIMSQNYPSDTFELKISFLKNTDLKESIVNFLNQKGFSNFVEGAVDDLDIDFDYGSEPKDGYAVVGGELSPLSIYDYDRSVLETLMAEISDVFQSGLDLVIVEHSTKQWMEGWKEGFKPISTDKIYIYPPWLSDSLPDDKHNILIEPGMAFGTGQHATTKLCLLAVEGLDEKYLERVIDVGSGTGILSIAASKLGAGYIMATDIDEDAVDATKENFRMNDCEGDVEKGSVVFSKRADSYSLVIANILAVVLRKIMPELSNACKQGGRVVLSGILTDESPELISIAESSRLMLKSHTTEGDWSCLVMERI